MSFGDILGPLSAVTSYFNPALGIGLGLIAAYDNKRQAEGSIQTGLDAQITALDDASALVDESYLEAIGFLEAGNHEAAGHIIQAAKIASRHILEYGNLSIETQEKFYEIADAKLQPFVDQGLFAQDEVASMLGIPNSKGELVPFDVNDLRETPGYQFQFEEGQRAVDSSASARGMTLSGRQMKEQMRYGDGLAQMYFGARIDQLMPLVANGLNASTNQAQLAQNAGQGIAGTQERIGSGLAETALWEGSGLAEIATAFSEALAGAALQRGSDQGNLAIGRGNAIANANAAQQGARNAFLENIIGLGTTAAVLGSRKPSGGTTTTGAGSGGEYQGIIPTSSATGRVSLNSGTGLGSNGGVLVNPLNPNKVVETWEDYVQRPSVTGGSGDNALYPRGLLPEDIRRTRNPGAKYWSI